MGHNVGYQVDINHIIDLLHDSRYEPLSCKARFIALAGGWTQQVKQLLHAEQQLLEPTYFIHPCVVEGRKTLVYPQGLAAALPDQFTRLQQLAAVRGYCLLEDRRQRDTEVAVERRRHWSAIVTFSACASLPLSGAAEQQVNLALYHQPGTQIQLPTIEQRYGHPDTASSDSVHPQQSASYLARVDKIKHILLQHYQASPDTPDYVQLDLEKAAAYFGRHEQASRLLFNLQGKPWKLVYAKDTYRTQVRGSQLRVHSATVFFDSRAAARLRSHKRCESQPSSCIATPADALLHELLHLEESLLNSTEFIAEGGLNSVLYPFSHEARVIKRENALYAAMSATDGGARPHRRNHSGSLKPSTCVTCIQ